MVTHQPLDDSLGGDVQARFLPTRMRFWREVASGTILAQYLLDEGETHAEHVGNGALQAELPLAGTQNLLTSIDRIGSHTNHAKRCLAYDQVNFGRISQLSASAPASAALACFSLDTAPHLEY
jgi:hypothetical protein